MTFKAVLFGYKTAGRVVVITRKEALVQADSARRRLFRRIGRMARDRTRKNITEQRGPDGRPWPKLSKWTRAQTGRRKALITLRNQVKFKASRSGVRVFFVPVSSEWNLTSHDRGFTEPADSRAFVKIPLRNPQALGVKGNSIFIRRHGRIVVPPRPVWPRGKQLDTVVLRALREHRRDMERRYEAQGAKTKRVRV